MWVLLLPNQGSSLVVTWTVSPTQTSATSKKNFVSSWTVTVRVPLCTTRSHPISRHMVALLPSVQCGASRGRGSHLKFSYNLEIRIVQHFSISRFRHTFRRDLWGCAVWCSDWLAGIGCSLGGRCHVCAPCARSAPATHGLSAGPPQPGGVFACCAGVKSRLSAADGPRGVPGSRQQRDRNRARASCTCA